MDEIENGGNKVSNAPPLCFKIAKWLQKRKIRGGFRLEQLCHDKGLLDVQVRYVLNDQVVIDVPLALRPYDFNELMAYEWEAIQYVSSVVNQYHEPFTFLDCGADIGLFSSHLVADCPSIERIIAFEPNPISYPFLCHNMELLSIRAEAKKVAVGDFAGRAELLFPEFDSHAHAAFIAPKEGGDIEVMRIDDLDLPKGANIILKVDVEGGELAVMRGAAQTICEAKNIVIVFEAHYKQVERVGIDPIVILRYLKSLRPCKVRIAEREGVELDWSKPFFEQFSGHVFNVCVHSL